MKITQENIGLWNALIKLIWQTLYDEIEAINGKVEEEVWEAIDSVRKIGNIGAHMEKDIDVIIDVDPNEAELLIGLIEQLLEEWYVNKHKRQERMKQIKQAAEKKIIEKKKDDSAASSKVERK